MKRTSCLIPTSTFTENKRSLPLKDFEARRFSIDGLLLFNRKTAIYEYETTEQSHLVNEFSL